MTLYLLCDISGSMMEGGKFFTMRTVAMTVAQWVRFEEVQTQILLYCWNSEMIAYENWTELDELPFDSASCHGNAEVKTLIQVLGKKPDGKVLILTDGFLSQSGAKDLKRWKDALPSEAVRFIKIGADAHSQLQGSDVYPAEEIFAALDGWLEGGVG